MINEIVDGLVGKEADMNIGGVPRITTAHTSLALVEGSRLGTPGPGGAAFQQAIQHMNANNIEGSLHSFQEALDKGLDPLRHRYAQANLGQLLLKKGNLQEAVAQFVKVLENNQALYDSVHLAAQRRT